MSSAGEKSWIGRLATYVLPALSVLVAALVFLGPGSLQWGLGARVRGAPGEGARAAALRVELVRSRYDVIDGAGARKIEVTASAPGQSLGAWRGMTGPDGIAEVRLEARA